MVLTTKPHTSPLQLPIRKQATARQMPGTQCQRSSQRSSGYFAKSGIDFKGVLSCSVERIQPTCDHQKLVSCGECGSCGVSEWRGGGGGGPPPPPRPPPPHRRPPPAGPHTEKPAGRFAPRAEKGG